jgi:two-component system sensor histidine kinase UhpB
MSLKHRLLGAIALVLLAALLAGSVLTWLGAQRKVAQEIDAAMSVSRATVERAMTAISRSFRPEQHLASIVSVFDGDRHVRASLVTPRGDVLLSSRRPDLPNAVPAWFAGLFAGERQTVTMAPPGGLDAFGSIVLEADPLSEIDAIWGDAVSNFSLLALIAVLILGFVWWTLEWALKPLERLAAAFGDIGDGRAGVMVPEQGPADLKPLYAGFNAMSQRLAEMAARNAALTRQLDRVQEEERSGLARDLHDEVSPFLFAVDVDAATVERLAGGKRLTAKAAQQIAQRAGAIREATGHMKRQVRQILGQLRPEGAVALGLEEALLHLAAQVEERHPRVSVDVAVDETSFGATLDSAIQRLVREAVNNALKHGTPAHIRIAVTASQGAIDVEVVDDGGGMREPAPGAASGYGLAGMKERVEALGGAFTVGAPADAAGVRVHAVLPRPAG